MKGQNEDYINFKDSDNFTGYTSLQENTYVLKAFDEGVVLENTPEIEISSIRYGSHLDSSMVTYEFISDVPMFMGDTLLLGD